MKLTTEDAEISLDDIWLGLTEKENVNVGDHTTFGGTPNLLTMVKTIFTNVESSKSLAVINWLALCYYRNTSN